MLKNSLVLTKINILVLFILALASIIINIFVFFTLVLIKYIKNN